MIAISIIFLTDLFLLNDFFYLNMMSYCKQLKRMLSFSLLLLLLFQPHDKILPGF